MKWLLLVAGLSALVFTTPLELEASTCPSCIGDLNCDGVVDETDMNIVLACWGPLTKGACADADLDGDGAVGSGDLGIVLAAWGPCP